MKNIVFISPYTHSNAPSGARKRAECLSCALKDLKPDARVTMLSPWKPPAGVRHVLFSLEGSWFLRLFNIIRLNFLLHKLTPDLVISESPIAPCSFLRFKLLHVIHDAKFTTSFGRKSALFTYILHFLSARIATEVLTVSDSEKLRILKSLKLSSNKVRTSYNGISDIWFDHPLPSIELKKKYKFLYVSNFAPHKGHLKLLKILRNVTGRIAFVGTDFGEMSACKDYARVHRVDVDYYSNLSEIALIDLYDSCEVFLFPSELEGFGIPYLEARVRRLPVIANDIPIFRELQSQIGGLLVDFNDEEAVCESIETSFVRPIDSTCFEGFRWKAIAKAILI